MRGRMGGGTGREGVRGEVRGGRREGWEVGGVEG